MNKIIYLLVILIALATLLCYIKFTKNTNNVGVSEGQGEKSVALRLEGELQIKKDIDKTIEEATTYLISQQSSSGCWFDPAGSPSLGMTALATTAIHKYSLSNKGRFDENINKAVLFLQQYVRDDVLLPQVNQLYSGYEVPLVLIALHNVDSNKYKDAIKILVNQILRTQLNEHYNLYGRESISIDNWRYGSWNYNENPQLDPDISVHIFNLEAVQLVRTPESAEAVKLARVFLQRCQNLKTVNDLPNSLDDGGFKHAPFAGKAGSLNLDNSERAYLSYGSVTCDGLLGLIYGGGGRNDRSFQSGVEWLKSNYAIDQNPGMGKNAKSEEQLKEERNVCLFYYYRSLAKLLDILNEDVFIDKDGVKHKWADELAMRIILLQKSDGSWCNESTTMWEGYPPLATTFNLEALQTIRKWIR